MNVFHLKYFQLLMTLFYIAVMIHDAASSARGSRADKVYERVKGSHNQWWMSSDEKSIGSPCTPNDCALATTAAMIIGMAKGEPDERETIISDLTSALKCSSTKMCECAEEGTTPEDVDGRKICIKPKGSLDSGDECIHNLECKEKLACVIDATKENADDIEDTRRYCSHSSTFVPATVLLILTIVSKFI
ncbi:unnamed protein product [Orchesella dallaii]|uniref:Uncharacterized protein n=1 Tax=Orchesella dallaii TaxID=48710 RepID=A0ABP1QCA2_9HEXA